MKIIYIAGPYRASTEWKIIENIRKAEELAIKVWQKGMVALCPHKNTAHFGGLCPNEVWLEGGLACLRVCDAILMLPGWILSQGANLEHKEANRLGIPIYYDIRDIPRERKNEKVTHIGGELWNTKGILGQRSLL